MYSRSAESSKDFGKYRAALTLAKAISGNLGDDAEQMPEHTIEKQLKRSNGGLEVDVEGLPLSRSSVFASKLEDWRSLSEKKREQDFCQRVEEIEVEVPGIRDLLREFLTLHHRDDLVSNSRT